MIMWSAVILRIFENGSTRSPGQGSTARGCTGPAGAAAGGRGPGPGGAGAGGVAPGTGALLSVSITATRVCTGTVWPSCTLISASTPAAGAGISASTLSVEISNNGSSRFTGSPSCLSHLLKVPSAMDSPIWGMRTSMRAIMSPRGAVGCQLSACRRPTADNGFSVRREPPCRLNDVFRLRQHEVLQRRRIRQRHVVGGHPHDRPVEPFERLLVDAGRDLPGDAPGAGVLVHDQHLVGLLHRAHDRGVVHWQERPEVQHLRRDTVFLLEL